MSPLFVIQEIIDCIMLEVMKIYKKKTDQKAGERNQKSSRCCKSDKILLYTLMSRWYMQHDLRHKAVQQLIQCEQGNAFACFTGVAKVLNLHVMNGLLTKPLDLQFLIIWKRLMGPLRSRSLSQLLQSRDPISVALLCIN